MHKTRPQHVVATWLLFLTVSTAGAPAAHALQAAPAPASAPSSERLTPTPPRPILESPAGAASPSLPSSALDLSPDAIDTGNRAIVEQGFSPGWLLRKGVTFVLRHAKHRLDVAQPFAWWVVNIFSPL